jgi:flagellar hook-basal body complex protein FliE
MNGIDNQGIDQLLQQLNSLSARAAGQPDAAPEAGTPQFSEALKAALQQVDATQQQADRLTREFDLNPNNVDLHEVMASLQKASLSFQTMVQVRNQLVSAYQEIMNMQI